MRSATREIVPRTDPLTGMENRTTAPYRSAVLALCLTALVSLPLWFVTYPPLYDYPFHLARLRILHDIAAGGPLGRYYEVNSFLIPNVAMDGIGLALQGLFSIENAGRIFLLTTMLLAISGTAFLARTLYGKTGAAPWFAAAITYNWVFSAGFVNYLFAVALLPWAIGLYLRVRHGSAAIRLSSTMLVCLALFFSHLIALVIYALVVAAFELQWGLRTLRDDPMATVLGWLFSALPLLATALLFVTLSPTAHAAADPVTWNNFRSPLGFVRYKAVWPFRALRSGSELVDDISAIAAIALAVAVAFLGRIRIKREPLIAIAILGAMFWLAPWRLFSAQYVDVRLPIAVFLVAAACAEITIPGKRAAAAIALAAGALLTFRSVALAAQWAAVEPVEREIVEAYRCLEPGSVLFAADTEPGLDSSPWPDIGHFASIAEIITGSFVPATWAHPAQQPIGVKAQYADIYEFQTPSARKVADAAALQDFQREIEDLMVRRKEIGRDTFGGNVYLLLLFPRFPGHTQMDGATVIADRHLFTLYRLAMTTDGGPSTRGEVASTCMGR
jgi:hypothetical protein